MFPLVMKDGYQLVKDSIDFTEEKRVLQQTGHLYRDFMLDEGLMMTLNNEFIRILAPSTAFDPSFEPAMAKALQKVASVAQSNPKPDFAFGLWQGKVTELIKQPLPANVEALLGIAPGVYDLHLMVEGKADSPVVEVRPL